MSDLFPATDLLAKNIAAAMLAAILLLVCAQCVVHAVLKMSTRIMRISVFEDVTPEDRLLLENRIKRSARHIVLLLSVLLVLGAVFASYLGRSAVGLGQAFLSWFTTQDLWALQTGLLKTFCLLLAAVTADAAFRAIMAALERGLSQSRRLLTHRPLLLDALTRIRGAGRAVIWAEACLLFLSMLPLPEASQHVLRILLCAFEAVFVSQAASRTGHLVTEIGFGLSDELNRLERPLSALRDLKNLTAITKLVWDFLVYVGAATWVAGQISTTAWYYNLGQIGLRLIIIFYACRVLVEASTLLLHEMLLGPTAPTEVAIQRRRTLLPVIRAAIRYGTYFTGVTMGLTEANIDPTPLFAGAGVVGVAIGLGAQTFVGDVVAGFFILFEDLILVGDVVEIGSIKGTVEEIGIRLTMIRDDFGVLHCIPNGEVRRVSNHSRGHVNSVVDVFIPYEENLLRVRSILEALAPVFLEEKGLPKERIEVKVQELTDAAIMLRLAVQVPPGRDEDLTDVLRENVVYELTKAGVAAPRTRKAMIIDSTLRIGLQQGRSQEPSPVGPANPFSPSKP